MAEDTYIKYTREISSMIMAIRSVHPQLRYCQIISNAAAYAGYKPSDLFYLEDNVLIDGLKIYMERCGLL